MKRIFLDTNILLDFALEREHADDAEKILALGLAGAIEVCASYLSFANYQQWKRLCRFLRLAFYERS